MKKYKYIIFVNCAAHCIQLLVKDIMKIDPFKSVFENARKMSRILTEQHNLSQIINLQKAKNLKPLTIILYTETRQNSQLHMLERLEQLKSFIKLLESVMLSNAQQNLMKSIIDFLKPFEQITKIIEKDNSNNAELQREMVKLKFFVEKKTNDEYLGKSVTEVIRIMDKRQDYTFNNKISTVCAFLSKITKDPDSEKKTYDFIQEKGFSILKHVSKIGNSTKSIEQDEIKCKIILAEQFSKFVENIYPFNTIPHLATIDQFQTLSKYKIPELTLFAKSMLKISTTEACVERSFSKQKRIHRPERSCLLHSNVQKELFIQMNFPFYDDVTKSVKTNN